MNKRWRNIGLGALLVLAIVVIAPAFFGGGGGSQPQVNTIRYSEFVEAVKDDQISRVLISPDQAPLRWLKTTAVVPRSTWPLIVSCSVC